MRINMNFGKLIKKTDKTNETSGVSKFSDEYEQQEPRKRISLCGFNDSSKVLLKYAELLEAPLGLKEALRTNASDEMIKIALDQRITFEFETLTLPGSQSYSTDIWISKEEWPLFADLFLKIPNHLWTLMSKVDFVDRLFDMRTTKTWQYAMSKMRRDLIKAKTIKYYKSVTPMLYWNRSPKITSITPGRKPMDFQDGDIYYSADSSIHDFLYIINKFSILRLIALSMKDKRNWRIVLQDREIEYNSSPPHYARIDGIKYLADVFQNTPKFARLIRENCCRITHCT